MSSSHVRCKTCCCVPNCNRALPEQRCTLVALQCQARWQCCAVGTVRLSMTLLFLPGRTKLDLNFIQSAFRTMCIHNLPCLHIKYACRRLPRLYTPLTCISMYTVQRCTTCPKSSDLAGNGNFFLSLLPPKKVLDAFEPVAAQLQFQPQPQHVVRLSEIMKERPSHPSITLQKALTRLAPTCRKLWNQMDWISQTASQVCTA